MPDRRDNRLTRPETLTAAGILAVAAAFLVPTFGLRPISALLPAVMLIGLMVLAALMLIADQRRAGAGEKAEPVMQAPRRVGGAFALIAAYALATDFVGFYPSTIIVIPLVAWAFGYRSPARLALATAIVAGSIYLIFDLAMAQDFPAGRLWNT